MTHLGHFLLPVLFAPCIVFGATNITIDDTDPSTTHVVLPRTLDPCSLLSNTLLLYSCTASTSTVSISSSTSSVSSSTSTSTVNGSSPLTSVTSSTSTALITSSSTNTTTSTSISQATSSPNRASTTTPHIPSSPMITLPDLASSVISVVDSILGFTPHVSFTIANSGTRSTSASASTSRSLPTSTSGVAQIASHAPNSISSSTARPSGDATTTTTQGSSVSSSSNTQAASITNTPASDIVDSPVTSSATVFSSPPKPTSPKILDVDISGDINYIGNWTTGDNVCGTGPTKFAGSPDDSFTVSFQGSQLFINVVKFPGAGILSLSINGGAAQVFNLSAPEVECTYVSPQVPTLSRRDLDGRDSADAENQCTGKVVNPPIQLDGASYRREVNADRALRSRWSLNILIAIQVATLFLY